MPHLEQFGKSATIAARWLSWADQDYIAARVLLLKRLIVQGSGLSNTAIEKYLKTALILRGIPFPRGRYGHDVVLLNESLIRADVDLKLNAQYLNILTKSYRLRYPDDLEAGFNVVLEQVKMLTELDSAERRIRKGFEFKEGDRRQQMRVDFLLEQKAPELLERNCAFGECSRVGLFSESSQTYELRILPEGVPLEAIYETDTIKDDGRFDLEALKPGKN
jgi:hypothetical protein